MHVVVLGAGYAGVALVQRLERSLPAAVDITLVDEREKHLVQHLIHRTIRTPALAEKLTLDLETLCPRATHRQSRVTAVHRDSQQVELEDGLLEYDVCAVCLGAQTAYHGLPGVPDHALPLKRLSHATRIRERFQRVSETGGRALVCGAGLSGIQVAGELVELAREASTNPEIGLLEQESEIAPAFDAGFRDAVRDELESRGVVVRTNHTIERADDAAVWTTDGTRLPHDLLVWTGGIEGQDALAGERWEVRSTLAVDDRTFGLGDAVRVVDADGRRVEPTAQAAVGQAAIAATNVERTVSSLRDGTAGFGPRLDRYRRGRRIRVVTVGDGTVAAVGSSVLRGPPARALKTSLGARHLGSVGDLRDALGYLSRDLG